MKRSERIVALLCALALGACGPWYSTDYRFFPPKNPQGRQCVATCGNTQAICRNTEQARASDAQAACENNAAYQYDRCLRRTPAEEQGKKCSKSYCSYSPSTGHCEEEYRACYGDCGGIVETHRVCTFNCPEPPAAGPSPAASLQAPSSGPP